MMNSFVSCFPGEEIATRNFLAAIDHAWIDAALIGQLIKRRDASGHKGNFGHLLLIAGSEGKSGAAILAAKSALRTGCGLLTAAISEDARTPLLTLVPEAMTMVRDDKAATKIPIDHFNAIAFGPGAGMQAGAWLMHLLEHAGLPMVIDADGLNLLSVHAEWQTLLSPQIILTPHPGEFERLTHTHASKLERLKTQLEFSRNNNVIVLLKGQNTSVAFPDGRLYFNTTGNSGMATAGSGDVLTGIIGSLLAQGYEPEKAVLMGVYLHGFAGDDAAARLSKTSLIASDIIEAISAFFRKFET